MTTAWIFITTQLRISRVPRYTAHRTRRRKWNLCKASLRVKCLYLKIHTRTSTLCEHPLWVLSNSYKQNLSRYETRCWHVDTSLGFASHRNIILNEAGFTHCRTPQGVRLLARRKAILTTAGKGGLGCMQLALCIIIISYTLSWHCRQQ
jgi:hypothetical protein